MTHTGIECFLAICRHKTGSAAAQSLYITQPSLSARLKVLEQEVGVQLFYRRKGSREMVLTSAGQEFYQLAVQYEELVEKMHKLGQPEHTTLRIACFNSLGTYLLPAVYRLFLQSNPGISLQMQDMESLQPILFIPVTASLRKTVCCWLKISPLKIMTRYVRLMSRDLNMKDANVQSSV